MTTPTLADPAASPSPALEAGGWLQRLPPVQWWLNWIRPRSADRDEAFRETTIRATTGVLLVLGILAQISSYLVYSDDFTEPVSYSTVTNLVLIVFVLSALAVTRQRVMLSGVLLVAALLIGALGATIISGYWFALVSPMFMLITVITALTLPRNSLLPVGLVIVLLFALIATLQEPQQRQAEFLQEGVKSLSAQEATMNVIFLVAVAVLLLRQLRLEFDNRLAAMGRSMRETEKARAEADRANQAKSRFLASMSHEFRTPLNAIIGYVDIMLVGMAGNFTDKQHQLHNHIKTNATRLLSMINNTLDMAKIEAGRVEIRTSKVDPRDLITSLVSGMGSLAENKKIYLEPQICDDAPLEVTSDVPKLQQVVTNLVGNALKFTTKGGVTVRVAGGPDSNYWTIQVADTGIGMPPDAAAYVFEAYKQVNSNNHKGHEGTGLGLAITHQHVRLMGGNISLETAEGQGTTFTVTLPRYVQDDVVELAG